MAYYLPFDGSNDRVSFSVPATGALNFMYWFRASRTGTGSFTVAGIDGAYSNYIQLTANNEIKINANNSSKTIPVTDTSDPNVVYWLKQNSNNVLSVYESGVNETFEEANFLSSVLQYNNFGPTLDVIGRSGTIHYQGRLDLFGYINYAETNDNFIYAVNDTNGTGSSIPDSSGNGNASATLLGFPTDGSQYVQFTDVTPNVPPNVTTGANQTGLTAGDTATLTGSATDGDGTVDTLVWTQTGGSPTVTVTNTTPGTATFTVPSINADSTLTFTLTATDDDGATDSDITTMQVDLDPNLANTAPTATITADQSVEANELVTIILTGSDVDGDTLTYEFEELTNSNVGASVNGNTLTFISPSESVETVVTFRGRVFDGALFSNWIETDVTVSAELLSSTLILNINGDGTNGVIPDAIYEVDFHYAGTKNFITSEDVEFVNGTATQALSVGESTSVRYTIVTNTHFSGGEGVTS